MDKKTYFTMLYAASKTVVEYAKKWATDIESDELADIVVNHAIAAAVAGMGAGVLPGLGALIAGGISVGAIWHMYYAVGQYLHLTFGVNMLKAAAAAILSNIVHQPWGVLSLELAAAFIPLISIPATGLIFFSVTYFSGLTFLFALARIFKAGGDPTKMTADEMAQKAKEAAGEIDFSGEYERAKEGFKKMHKEGNLEDISRGVKIDGD